MYKSLIIVVLFSLIYGCNQREKSMNHELIFNKILLPTSIHWDTIPNGFGEGLNLLHKEFDILYITDSSINKITTNNEIENDSILIVTTSSILTTFKILSVNKNQILFFNSNKIDTLFFNNEKRTIEINKETFSVLNKVSKESYVRLNNILTPDKIQPPNEVEPPK